MQFYSVIDDFVDSIRTYTQSSLDSFIDIKSALTNSKDCWLTRDGSIASAIRVDGTFADPTTSTDFLDSLEREVRALLLTPGMEVKMIFDYGGREHYSEVMREAESYIRTLDLTCNLGWLYQDIINNYANKTYKECTYIIVYSTLRSFNKDIVNLSKKGKQEFSTSSEKLSYVKMANEMLSMHRGRVESFLSAVTSKKEILLSAKLLSLKNLIEANRRHFFPGTSPAWQADMPDNRKQHLHIQEGRQTPVRIKGEKLNNLFASASIAKQVFDLRIDDDRDYFGVSGDMVQIGDYVHQAIMIDRFQAERRDFQDLFNRLIHLHTAWTFTLHFKSIEPSFWRSLEIKRAVNNILSTFDFAGSAGDLKQSWDYISDARNDGQTVVEVSGGLSFSAPLGQAEKLTDHINEAEGMLTAWGSTAISRKQSDKLYMLMSVGSIGLCRRTPGQKVYAPLNELLQMAPLTRPAKPYVRGSLPLRTSDGKLIPIALTTSEVGKNRSTLTAAPPRYGKSLFMAIRALCVIAESTTGKLPFLSFFDIGGSSQGLLYTLKSSLDPEKKHEVYHYDMDVSARSTINIFDTPLGVRIPNEDWISQITNFIVILCTTEQDPPQGLPGLISQVVRRTYREFTDSSYKAKSYSPIADSKIHDWLTQNNYAFDDKTTWWEVVDYLIEQNEFVLAQRAQTFAVPILQDTIPILHSAEFDHDKAETVGHSKTTIAGYAANRINDAAAQFAFIDGPTKVNVGFARIISVDFLRVKEARGGGTSSVLVLAYLLVLWQVYSRFALNLGEIYPHGLTSDARPFLEEMLGRNHTEKLFNYHVNLHASMKNDYKEMVVDESHEMNTAGDRVMRVFKAQLVSMIRNGPKFNQAISLISQQVEDFMGKTTSEGEVVDNFAQLIDVKHILNMQFDRTEQKMATIRSYFKINDRQIEAMARSAMPGPFGSNVFYMSRRQSEIYLLNLFNTLPANAVWINSSTNESRIIREKLTKAIGFKNAINVLAKNFPTESEYTRFMEMLNDVILMNPSLDRTKVHEEFFRSLVEDNFVKDRFLNL